MRKLSITLIAAMLFSTVSLFANNADNSREPTKTLSEQIGDLLYENYFTEIDCGETAEITFTLNSEKEIVVLSVVAEDSLIDSFIKSRLNYQEVEVDSFEEGKKYTVKVSIQA